MPFISPTELQDLETSQRSRQSYQTYRALASQQQAESVTSLARTYPTMRPGEVLPLAKAGVRPETPVAKKAAQASAKKGSGWSFGKFLKGVANVADEAVYDPIKGISRGMAIGLSAPGEMVQGIFRESVTNGFQPGDILRGARQTTMSAGIDEIRREGITGADYGSGFFAGEDVKNIQVQRARQGEPTLGMGLATDGRPRTIRGKGNTTKAITMGRYTADKIFEPGTRRYGTLSGLIDATVAIVGDPTTFVGGSARRGIEASRTLVDNSGKVREVVARADPRTVSRITASRAEGLLDDAEADRLLEQAGALTGHPRKTVLPERVAGWLDGKDGRRLRDYLSTETDFERMRQLTKGKVDVETLVKLTDAKSDAEVLDILGPQLGVTIRDRFGVSRVALDAAQGGNGFRASRAGGARSRLASQMPGTHMDLTDADNAVETTARLLATVKAPREQVAKWTEQMARATDRNGRFSVYRSVLDDIRDTELKAQGARLSGSQRTALTRIWDDYDDSLRRYAIDEVGENARIPGAMIDGAGKALPSPHLYNEYVNTAVPLPDARELRRATSTYVGLIDKAKLRPGYDAVNTIADFTTQSLFKPLVLFRGAWTVRVVGEEQIRLAASGLTSAFVHPFSHIALAIGKKGGQDITGTPMIEADEFQAALSRGSAGFGKDSSVVRSRNRVVIDRNQIGVKFDEALLDEIGKLSSDPVAQRVLGGLRPGDAHPDATLTGVDAVKDWFFNGAGQKFRNEMANADKGGDRAFLMVKADPAGGANSADGYIDSIMERAKNMAGGDARLLEAMSTGNIAGKPLSFKNPAGDTSINRAALAEIRKVLDEGAGPQKVPADQLVHVKNGPGNELLAMYDKSVEVMFNTLMSKPTNFLSRSPAFQQFYWKRNAELVTLMSPETQAQAIRVARETGMPKHLVKQMEAAARRGAGELNVAEADMVSKAFALESTRKLLYDLSDRSQFFDITRAIFPFGEAWKEVATTWARIGVAENPVALRRAQQVVTGLRSSDTNSDGEGFFYTDEQTGEEVFNYPFSGWIGEKLTGTPFPLQATAKGLNIFSTSVIPGVGPVIQIPAGRLLPDTPGWDGIRKLVLPFGERNMQGGVLESFLPAWMQKARVALSGDQPPVEQQRMYANTVMDVSRYLVSTGEYSLDSDEEKARTLEAAEERAKKIYGYRALAQFFVPSPPSPEALVADKDGDLYYSIKLVEDMRKMQDEDYTTATTRFIEKWGEGAFLTTISKTTGAGTPNQDLYDFARENPGVARSHRDVLGYFMEQGGEFSNEAYQWQMRSGQRKSITPEQALDRVNQRLGENLYRQAQTKVSQRDGKAAPTVEERVWLSQVRDAIREEYPGYNATPGNLDEQEQLISKMVRASRDPVLSKTEVGQGVADYVKEREQAIQLARSRGLTTFQRAKGAEDIRDMLRQVANEIGEDNPDFLEVFDRTFGREMVDDVVDEEG